MRVGFDIGGTFTDVILLADDGRILSSTKVLSLLERVGNDISDLVTGYDEGVDGFIHGTTIASNAVIEDNMARAGFVATRGFRDDLELRSQRRPNIFDVNWQRPRPIIPRALRVEVPERVRSTGAVDRDLDVDAARAVLTELVDADVEAVAVCLINSFMNPEHEVAIKELLHEIAPEVFCCISSELHPEIREYERASTTALNACLAPVVQRYLEHLREALQHHSKRILIMQSNGGIMTDETAARRPVYMIESGPAAGVLAAARLARDLDLSSALSFDMGGTTAKACLVEDGIPVEKPGSEVGAGATIAMRMVGGNVSGAGYALRVPSLDIVEVGAGGGSIAWIDGGGALRVGPESASADPGPACYGRGGTQPTVTDANVVLGYINPDAIADAQLAIDAEAAAATIQRVIADPLGLPLLEAAYGITLVANATMMRALRAVSTERGRDPRRSSLIAFGGAGPLHAASLSASMGITKVVVPPYSGVFSALGLLLADFRQDYVRSIAQPLLEVSADTVLETFAELERTAAADAEAQGVPADSVRLERRVDLKYDYQIAEMTLPFPEDLRGDELAAVLTRAFSEEHEREFRYASNDPIDLINLRLRATAPASDLRFADLGRQGRAVGGSRAARSREAYFGPEVGSLTSPVVVRGDLTTPTEGPLIIEEPDTTVVVPRGWTAALDDGTGSVVITHESHAATADTAHADTAHADTAHADTAREATR